MARRSGCKELERSGKERGEGDGGGGGGGGGVRDGVSGGGGCGGGSVRDGVSNSRITWRYLQLHRYDF